MDDTTILGGTLNQLGQAVKQTAKQAVKIPEEMAKDAAGQIGGSSKPAASAASNAASSEPKQKQWQSDEERVSFLKSLYGSNDNKPSEFQEKIADKPIEEQKNLAQLRGQLHKENYYDPTFNPPKKQEERPAEKVEKEKKQEMQELQKKEEKAPPPLAVVRERNKAEMFRGAAG